MGEPQLAAIALAACAFAATPAGAQAIQYKPAPVGVCFNLSAQRIGPDMDAAAPLPHELKPRLAEALAACEQAVKERPTEGRLHGRLARLRLLSGDGPGAVQAARKAAELRSSTAQVLLALLHVDGVHLPRDYPRAWTLLRLAARDGNPYAHFNLGVMFANGWGEERDDEDAAASFRKAAAAGDPLAMQIFAQRHDREQAQMWLKKAAEAMYPDGPGIGQRIAELGRAAPDTAALVAWYEAKARAGELWAQAYMGMLHESGQWVRQDYLAAADWYRMAGIAGHVPAQLRMNRLYYYGRGVPRDEAEAKRWGEMREVQRCEALERGAAGANACDRLAAEPAVDSWCMRHFAQRAVAACAASTKEFPTTVRYRAQLARALAHVGNFGLARREARSAAAAGSGQAMILMGVMEQRGFGAAKNDTEALAWYRKAADAGDARGASLAAALTAGPAMAMPGQMMAQPRRRPEGPGALHNLAAQAERAGNYEEAIKLYTRAGAQGFEPSELNLAQMYEKGLGVKPDRAEAMKRYRRLASHGNGEARYRLASLAARAGEYEEALRNYQRGVRDDDYRAMLDLGQLHEQGRGVPRDARRAVALYEKAAERSPWARFRLGAMHLAGEGIPRDYAKAHAWLRRSADEGNAAALNNLGVMYERGLGVAVDPAAARELYIAALRGGSEQAKGNLESFYAEGRGAPAGAAELVAWVRPGAEAGVAAAQVRLGRMYAKREGVARDERAAAEWLMKAVRQGHVEARSEAAELYYGMGMLAEAAALGHGRWPAPREWPTGISLDPGEDRQRTIQVRVANVASIQGAAANAATADVYDIIRWFPPK